MTDAQMNTADKKMQETVTGAARKAGGTAANMGDAVRDAAQKVSAAATDFGQEAVARGTRYGQNVVEQVEAQPLTSVIIAAAAGLVAGLLIARR